MKLLQTIKTHLPVSRKAHQAALAKAHQAHDVDNSYLMAQLKQVTAANVRLEAKLHQGKDLDDTLEG